ncbi:MAG TPA: M48 family metalloprotease, partial [Thermoleophilaceae bacterium]|nr:M48 family metalloprotease [Thermoleophilaceae bacterium]
FEPLPEGELRSDVLELADRAEVSVGEVYRVDASRRTTAANAYVGGLGETKRVVLYDNLIEGLPADQARAVVAHELGHVAHEDLRDGLLWIAIVALPSMLVVQRLAEAIARRRGLRPGAGRRESGASAGVPAGAGVTLPGVRAGTGMALPGVPGAVPAVALSLALVAFAVQIPANWLSRQVEAHADAFALRITEDPAAFVGLQRSLDVRNVSEPDPPEALQKLLGTHPTTLERIGFALASARER